MSFGVPIALVKVSGGCDKEKVEKSQLFRNAFPVGLFSTSVLRAVEAPTDPDLPLGHFQVC